MGPQADQAKVHTACTASPVVVAVVVVHAVVVVDAAAVTVKPRDRTATVLVAQSHFPPAHSRTLRGGAEMQMTGKPSHSALPALLTTVRRRLPHRLLEE